MTSRARAFLFSTQNNDGGWGYGPGQASAVEPTAAALLAMREDPAHAESRSRTVVWLQNAQHSDGGWGFNQSDSESTWHTAWAVLALGKTGEAVDVSKRGAEWLLNVKTFPFTEESQKSLKQKLMIDVSLRGWPWLPEEASWIEPTAITLLALESIDSTLSTSARLKEAVRYLLDRRCPGGGWNVGNPVMFNSALPARVHPTAWVLLALSRLAPNSILPEDLTVLRSEMHREGSSLALASGLLALRTLGESDPLAQTRLTGLQGPDGGWAHNPFQTAVAMMVAKGYL